jgi:hypothetical protein
VGDCRGARGIAVRWSRDTVGSPSTARVRQAYAKATAEAELLKQYEFMHRIFHNARRRIDDTDSEEEQRRVLKILGDAALEEHSEWLLLHRERSIDQKEILRL